MAKIPPLSAPVFDPLLGDVTYARGPYSDTETEAVVHLPSPEGVTRHDYFAAKEKGPVWKSTDETIEVTNLSLGEPDRLGRYCLPTALSKKELTRIAGFKVISHPDIHARGSKKAPPIVSPRDFLDLAKRTAEHLPDTIEGRVAHLSVLFAKVASGEPPAAIFKAMPALAAKPREQVAPTDPLAAARARGRHHALELYEHPDNLTLLDARDYAGRNERKINEQRQAGEVYALLPPGKMRGFRYPKWQFDAEPERLKDALKPFVDASSNCWVIHSFMLGKRALLNSRAPSDVIVDSAADLKPVIDLAESEIAGEQGAQ
ncbi:MAG: hypothetical protein EPN70_15145 [Paraburkholderia sp.]|uniref:hypothetical protein n=1 Tax=Paraburkholderia sp. TaxID=1926495 RepID=UPI00121087E1|nr:hypothetical protein [Paraburkholderia sp.]TAM03127.1 MAG: hypothetical protein EPN70_15145 [Paraburkholderia sp.]TAM27669.1 MAG: hypothetical protein EPN59_18600 [Paraburkholderia sp.]